jgi:AraC-like DNA-binding protein
MLAAHHAGRPFLKAVHFTHEEPGYRAEYERIFGVPLTFGSDRNAMLVAEEFLSLTMPPANPYVTRVLRDHAEMLLVRLARTTTVRGRVETILLAGLHESDTSMEKIATELGCSRQTLRRRLKAEGTSFEALLDQLRHKMAIHYLDEGNVSISEAAYMVGFSEPAAFSRAFKRWTGTSPRKRCL